MSTRASQTVKKILSALALVLLASPLYVAAAEIDVSLPPYNAGFGLDDTATLQAAIDASMTSGDPATTVRTALQPVYLPSKCGSGRCFFRISAPLRVSSVQGFRLYGDGEGSWIIPTADMPAALDLNGVAYSSFENFLVGTAGGTAIVTSGIQSRWDSATAKRSNTHNTFRNIRVGGRFVNGWGIGSAGSGLQVDNDSFFNCSAVGGWTAGEGVLWQHGFLVGSGVHANNLLHSFYRLTSIHVRYGVKVNATQASIWGGDLEDNEVDLHVTTTGYFKASGIRSETSQRLLVTGGPASFVSQITLEDIKWIANAIHPDGYWIVSHLGGSMVLTNVSCYENGNSSVTSARIYSDHADTTIIANGLSVGGTSFSPTVGQAFRFLGANAGAVVTGYTQLGPSGAIASHTRGPVTLP